MVLEIIGLILNIQAYEKIQNAEDEWCSQIERQSKLLKELVEK